MGPIQAQKEEPPKPEGSSGSNHQYAPAAPTKSRGNPAAGEGVEGAARKTGAIAARRVPGGARPPGPMTWGG